MLTFPKVSKNRKLSSANSTSQTESEAKLLSVAKTAQISAMLAKIISLSTVPVLCFSFSKESTGKQLRATVFSLPVLNPAKVFSACKFPDGPKMSVPAVVNFT